MNAAGPQEAEERKLKENSDTREDQILKCDSCLFIPSIFTPNGDGINDTWEIHGIDLYSNVDVQVFNRWGQIVYETEGEYVPWDGVSQTSNKDQEIATYYYVLNLNIDDKKYNGSVTIKR